MNEESLESAAHKALQVAFAAYRRRWPDGDRAGFFEWTQDELRAELDARHHVAVMVSPPFSLHEACLSG